MAIVAASTSQGESTVKQGLTPAALALTGVACLSIASSARAQAIDAPEIRPVAFTRLVSKIDRGTLWATLEDSIICVPAGTMTWEGDRSEAKTERLEEVFREEMERAGLKVEGDPNNLFEQTSSTSEYAVAGSINSINARFCTPYADQGNFSNVKGHLELKIDWQIYSRLERKIVAQVQTAGVSDIKKSVPNGAQILMNTAFAQTVQQLINQGTLRQVALERPRPPGPVMRAPSEKIDFTSPAGGEAATTITDAIPGVVVILAGDSQGSGFLFSRDGYILTNAHVVGGAKYVKIRWGDGAEGLGEVVRISHERDIALVKGDAGGRRPLALVSADAAPRPGDTVFAIGAPLDLKFQNTVTKGAFSAARLYDGLRFLQSDVSINPGNSGGPLLDEKARVLGVAVSGLRAGAAPLGINLFIPVQDALEFLNLSPAPTLARPQVIQPPINQAAKAPQRPTRAK